jgi:hypothetical protein
LKGDAVPITAELHCYDCGYVAAPVGGNTAVAPFCFHLVLARPGGGLRLVEGRQARCGRCGGPLYLDEIEVVRPRANDDRAILPARRGRPPKVVRAV